jgi:organic hydroperoxide reductase OsmC/OhrA
MAEYFAEVQWQREPAEAFVDQRYHRQHEWHFDENVVVPASSSPHIVPLPYSQAAAVDPEEALVASLSSCHMLFFLSIAASAGFVVERYVDRACGRMDKNEAGARWMSQVVLKPAVEFSGKIPNADDLAKFHHQAHQQCFIANSVRTEVKLELADAPANAGLASSS